MASVGFLVAGLLTGCASAQEREWDVASERQASADEIIDAGHAADIAVGKRAMVVTWEVQPEDDEGPAQGAWRLYDREGPVADGKFGVVQEASARIDAIPVRGGFLLTDYAKHTQHFLDQDGDLSSAQLEPAKAGSSLKGGVLVEGPLDGPEGWQVVLPKTREVVRLSPPAANVQGVELTSDGTVWVLLPWSSEDGPYRLMHAKDGMAPWTTETIPLPKGTGTSGQGISASGDRLFVVGGHDNGERTTVDTILQRRVGSNGWTRVRAKGIADNLTVAPTIEMIRNRRMVAESLGEGDWVQANDGTFAALRPPRTDGRAQPDVTVEGRWLWATEAPVDNSLHWSSDYGQTWDEFDR